MGMLLTNLSFAEQIIEKYSSMESYYFDDDLLVFYRESLAAGAGASSTYYTELALKLLFTFQNYQQSGQHLNLNWNLLSQTILKQAAAVSRETERILRPVIQKSQNQMLKRMERTVNGAVNKAADQAAKQVASQAAKQVAKQVASQAANQTEEILLERWLETGQMTDGQGAQMKYRLPVSRLKESQREQLRNMLAAEAESREREKRREQSADIQTADVRAAERRMADGRSADTQASEKQKEERKIWLEEILSSVNVTESQKELLKEVFTSVQETEIRGEQWREVLVQAEKAGYAGTMAELQNQPGVDYRDSETVIERVVEGLTQEIAGSRIRQSGKKNRPFLGGIGTARLRLQLFKEQEKNISQVHVEQWIRQMSPEDQALVWENLVQFTEEFVHVIPEGERLRERIQQLEKSSYTERSRIGNNGMIQGGQKYESGGLIPSGLTALAEQSPEEIYQFIRWIVSGDSGIPDAGNRESDWMQKRAGLSGNRSAETIVNLFRKYEDTVFQKTEEIRTHTEIRRIENMALFSDMVTILENRFTEPGRAKEAEKELRDILIHDLSEEETHLVWKTETERQSVQEKEERLRTFVNLLETPKVMATVYRRIEETDEKGKERLKEWVRKYQSSNSEKEFEKEKRELLVQVRETLGLDAARTLEHYFTARDRNADHGTRYETLRQIDESVKHIINSYVDVTGKENIADTLGGGESLYLNNRMREKVHEPSSNQAVRGKRNLDVVVDMVQRDYQFRQERILLLEKIRERIRTAAKDRFLGERTGSSIEHAEAGNSQTRRIIQSRERISMRQSFRDISRENFLALQILSEDLQPGSYAWQEAGENWKTKRERSSAAPEGRWEEVQTQFLRQQRAQESQMEETKKMVRVLKEKIEVQEKVMTELKRNAGQNKIPAQVNINQLTKQVMKKMEEELRVEKMRRGLL